MKTLEFFLIAFITQRIVLCSNEDDRHVEDHSHEDDREHINDWVVHIPKGNNIIHIIGAFAVIYHMGQDFSMQIDR